VAIREGLRPGGRSARVQEAVHAAAIELLAQMPRDELTIGLIATKANVTPSTIYRRWGDLATLLADVAVGRFYPDMMPADTGTLASDLESWAQTYQEEMSSAPGRAMLRDVLASSSVDGAGLASHCADIVRVQIQAIYARAIERGERTPTIEAFLDGVVAPFTYRLIFDDRPIDAHFARDRAAALIATFLKSNP
jgi:AcrR family transcriptional regulator